MPSMSERILKPIRRFYGNELLQHILDNEVNNDIVTITVDINPKMIAGDAIQLWEYGLCKLYITDADFRQTYDFWCLNTQWAELSFEEFIEKCGYPLSILLDAQIAEESCISQQQVKNTNVNSVSG